MTVGKALLGRSLHSKTTVPVRGKMFGPAVPCPPQGAEWALHGHPANMSTERSTRLFHSQQRVRDKENLTRTKPNLKLSLQSKPSAGPCTFPGGLPAHYEPQCFCKSAVVGGTARDGGARLFLRCRLCVSSLFRSEHGCAVSECDWVNGVCQGTEGRVWR